MSRRADGRTGSLRTPVIRVLAVLGVLLLPVCPSARLPVLSAQTADTVNRLAMPEIVQNHERTTARDDAAIVQEIEHKIKCTCGCGLDVFTCRTTDFTCATSPAMHRAVLARLDSSMTAAQVVAAFEAQYGQSILMEPPRRGFNWAAYLMPFVALLIGLGFVSWLMRRWVVVGSRDRKTEKAASAASSDSLSPDEPSLDRLRRELEHFEA